MSRHPRCREKRRVERCEECKVLPRRCGGNGGRAVSSGFMAERDNGGSDSEGTCARGYCFGNGEKVTQCLPEKEKTIMAALEHFQMI